jgi:hypothetical protein
LIDCSLDKHFLPQAMNDGAEFNESPNCHLLQRSKQFPVLKQRPSFLVESRNDLAKAQEAKFIHMALSI